jgi:hypothetical protein
MSDATGLILQFVRCNAAARQDEWARWLDRTYLPDLREIEGVRAATLWGLRVQPLPFMPSVGFTHAILIELSSDLATTFLPQKPAILNCSMLDRPSWELARKTRSSCLS